jgi:hypothetical protein
MEYLRIPHEIQCILVSWDSSVVENFAPKYTKLHVKVSEGAQYIHKAKISLLFLGYKKY